MSIVYLLIPLGLVLMALAVAAFCWAVDSGQYDDLATPARAPLDAEGDAGGASDDDTS